MRKVILIVLLGGLVIGLYCHEVLAKEKEIALSATASSVYYSPGYYGPDKAVDDNISTFWIGDREALPWWIMFDSGIEREIDKINIQWYYQYYTPTNYDIQVSADGVVWETLLTGLQGTYDINGEALQIGRKTRYLKLIINSVPYYYPAIRELKAFTVTEVPQLIRFQANLGDAQGLPLDGSYTLTFRLYGAETGGAPIWAEVQPDVAVEEGVLDVELGSVTVFNLPFERQYWLGVEVGSDGEMTPRFKLTTVPYSFISEE